MTTPPGPGTSPAVGPADLPVAVITVSDRCSRGVAEDRSGPLLAGLLAAAGYPRVTPRIVPDGVESVRDAVASALADGARIVLTTGGTGVAPRDLTPEGTREVITQELPGIAEAIRRLGAEKVPTAVLSRGVIGVAPGADGARALVANLPGSSGGVRDGWSVLEPLLPHVVEQLAGGDH